MGTPFNKAIVAIIMGIITLLNTYGNFHIGLTEEQLNTVIAILTPFLIYLIPNKPKV